MTWMMVLDARRVAVPDWLVDADQLEKWAAEPGFDDRMADLAAEDPMALLAEFARGEAGPGAWAAHSGELVALAGLVHFVKVEPREPGGGRDVPAEQRWALPSGRTVVLRARGVGQEEPPRWSLSIGRAGSPAEVRLGTLGSFDRLTAVFLSEIFDELVMAIDPDGVR